MDAPLTTWLTYRVGNYIVLTLLICIATDQSITFVLTNRLHSADRHTQ